MTKEDKTKSLVALSVDGGPPRQLISTGWKGMETKFSPDGKLLVAQRQKDGRSEILLLALDSGQEIPIGPAGQANIMPNWAADGRHLIFKSGRDNSYHFFAQRIENGKPRGEPVLLKKDVGQRAVISDMLNDGRLVYLTWSPGIAVHRVSVNPETGQRIGKPKLLATGRGGVPSPDGRRVAFNTFDWGTGAGSALGLRLMTRDGKSERTFSPGLVNPFVFGWFPDQKHLLLGGYESTGKRGLYRIDLATAKLETFYTADAFVSHARLAPDAQLIAFGMGHEGVAGKRMALYVIKPEANAKPKLLRFDPDAPSQDPAWSPDGGTIPYSSESLKSGVSRLLRISPNGGEPTELVRHEQEMPEEKKGYRRLYFPAWSPNGQFIVYVRNFYAKSDAEAKEKDSHQVWMVRVQDGNAVHVSDLDSTRMRWASPWRNWRRG